MESHVHAACAEAEAASEALGWGAVGGACDRAEADALVLVDSLLNAARLLYALSPADVTTGEGASAKNEEACALLERVAMSVTALASDVARGGEIVFVQGFSPRVTAIEGTLLSRLNTMIRHTRR